MQYSLIILYKTLFSLTLLYIYLFSDITALVLTDLIVLMQENNQKYTFTMQDNKVCLSFYSQFPFKPYGIFNLVPLLQQTTN